MHSGRWRIGEGRGWGGAGQGLNQIFFVTEIFHNHRKLKEILMNHKIKAIFFFTLAYYYCL